MSEFAYIEQLQNTKTYGHHVIEGIGEYHYRSLLGGMLQTLPSIPKATNERSVLVLQIDNNSPVLVRVLENPRDTVKLHTRQVNKIFFLFVSKKLKRVVVVSPTTGYRLGDGERICSDVDLWFQVTDTEKFWQASDDPIDMLEARVSEVTTQYFLGLSSTDIITVPCGYVPGAAHGLYEIHIPQIKRNLEKQLLNANIGGLEIKRVEIHLTLSETLKAFISRQYKRIWGDRGVFDRQFIDAQINGETTHLNPHLRDIMMRVDRRLLENFHSLPYGEAMKKVHERMSDLKLEFITKCNDEIATLKSHLQLAKDLEMDELQIEQLRDRLSAHIQAIANQIESIKFKTDEEFYNDIFKQAE